MEAIIFLSIIIALFSIFVSCLVIRRVKKQIAEITDALADVKNGNGNRRILSATNELVAPLAYEINEIVVSYEKRLSTVRQAEETNRQLIPLTYLMTTPSMMERYTDKADAFDGLFNMVRHTGTVHLFLIQLFIIRLFQFA